MNGLDLRIHRNIQVTYIVVHFLGMAVLGAQLVFSMVMASFLSKLSGHFSFGRWVLCGKLVRYLHPSDEELKQIAKIPPPPKPSKTRKHDKNPKEKETFTVPKSINIQLDSAPIKTIDMLPLQYYTEYQWLMDFAISAVFIYIMTELYYALFVPQNEFNLSMMWCVLMIGFCLKIMFSLTVMYFRTEEGGEIMLLILSGFFFLVFAMAILIIDEETLEFGLLPAYQNFSTAARTFLEDQGLPSSGPASLVTFKVILIIVSSVLGAFLTFPGLRLAKMHTDSLRYAGPLMQMLLYVNIIFPMLISLSWVKPIVKDVVVTKSYSWNRYRIEESTFEAARIIAIFIFCAFRFVLVWPHLQAHLNMAVSKIENLRKEAGRISNIELQKTVVRVFYYLCVVALQYLVPLLMLLFCSFMLKTLGEHPLGGALGIHIPVLRKLPSSATSNSSKTAVDQDSITATAAQFAVALGTLRQVFTATWFHGVFSFLCWWICTAWFTTSAFGLLYHAYFQNM